MSKTEKNPKPQMTREEMEQLIRERGGDPGQWGQFGGVVGRPKFLTRQAEHLTKLKAMLEGVVQTKQAEVDQLKEKLARLQHGGGQ